MKNLRFFLPLLAIALFLGSCKGTDPDPDTGTVRFSISPLVNGQSLVMGQTYNDPAGGRLQFEGVKFYLSRLELIADDNSTRLLQLVDLVDFDSDAPYQLEAEVPSGSYKGIRFAVGLDDSLNYLDPSTFAGDHPMSSLTGMYWAWSSKYIFVKVDGYGDSTQIASNNLSTFVYHTGLDTLYREVEFTSAPFVLTQGESHDIGLNLDFHEVFYNPADTIHFYRIGENFTHTTPDFELAKRFQDNFVAALKLN